VHAWGLEIFCRDAKCYSPVLTAVLMPEGQNADAFRKLALKNFDISLGSGLGMIAGKVFRIGHLGDINDLTLVGALAGVEMTLGLAGVPHQKGGVTAAMDFLTASLKTNVL
jgi:alanine-glyoxylate transaminase/serine-glyoxylate transaminase/serine-pyruvate transaminase